MFSNAPIVYINHTQT